MNWQYPQLSDLSTLLTDAGMAAPSNATMKQALSKARQDFLAETAWRPFLNGSWSPTGTVGPSASPVSIPVLDTGDLQAGDSCYVDSGSLQERTTVTAITDSTHVTVSALTKAHIGPFCIMRIRTRYFNPPGPRPNQTGHGSLHGGGKHLELGAGLIQLSSLAIGGNPYTAGTPGTSGPQGQYWLDPIIAPEEGWPYTRIVFWAPVYGIEQSVAIEGAWGFGSQIPDDAFQGILSRAAFLLIPGIAAAKGKGLSSITEDKVQYIFSRGRDAGPYAYESVMWMNQFNDAVATYRIPFLGA